MECTKRWYPTAVCCSLLFNETTHWFALRNYFLFFFWSLSLFLFVLFSLKTLSPQTWIITISSRWQSFSSAGIVALRVDQKMQNTENFCSTSTSPVWFRAQNAGCKLFAYAASHLSAHVKPLCNALSCARGTLHWSSTLEYAHFIVICRCFLAHTSMSKAYYEVLSTNITLSTLLILTVCRTRIIWPL